MSLQLAAQHIASRGRGPDTTLVHMAPQEVAGLQALARAHGGTLTINPDTGLPEAGFLQSILPTLIGAGLSVASGGTLTPMMAALITGGVTGAATGSLRKGLMAGLGAYGGAGIGSVVSGIGAKAIGAGLPAAVEGAAIAPEAFAGFPDLAATPIASATASPVTGAVASPVTQSVIQATPLVPTPPAYLQGAVDPYGGFPAAAPSAGRGAYTVDPFGGLDKAAAPGAAIQTSTPQPGIDSAGLEAGYRNQMDIAADTAAAAREEAAARSYRNQMDIASDLAAPRESALREAGPMGRFTRGLQEVVKKPSELFKKENMRYGLAALAPMMLEDQKSTQYRGSGPNPYRYVYSPGRLADPTRAGGVGEYQYFAPSYTRLAAGGTIEAMSDRNAQETFFANGGQRFADGGSTGVPQYSYDPRTQQYTEIAPVTATPVRTVTRMPGEYGGDIGPSSMLVPTGNINSNSITGGLIPAIVGQQPAAPVVDLSTYGPGTFGGGNFGADNEDAAIGAAIAAANQAAAQGAAGPGIAGLDAASQTVDVGGFGADNDDAGIGAAISDAAVSDAVAASDASSGVSDSGGSADGPGGGSGDLARGGLTALQGAFARGGYNLGDYSDGGRLLRGPGDGVSDSIPATIANKRPARLADGEFVVPARIVSELGNGSTEAGARKLYAMMDRIQKARKKSVGKGKVAVNSRADKLLPA